MMQGYILDLDNTLYDENQYLYCVFLDFWKQHFSSQENFQYICSQALSDEVRLHSKDIFKTFLELTPLGYSKTYHDELFDLYTTIRCELSLYEDAKEFLDYLHHLKYPVAILTNGSIQAQKNKIANLKLTHIPTFYARENGIQYEKPHPSAFLKVVDFFNISPQNCYMIGDNPITDLYGASQIGITPIWLQKGYAKNIECNINTRIIHNLEECIE